MNLGIPKKYIYISLVLFAFNMFVAATTYVPKAGATTSDKLLYILFPLGAIFLIGSLLGFIVLLFPVKKDLRPEIKYTRSKVVGILIVNLVFVFLYVYKLIEYYTVSTHG